MIFIFNKFCLHLVSRLRLSAFIFFIFIVLTFKKVLLTATFLASDQFFLMLWDLSLVWLGFTWTRVPAGGEGGRRGGGGRQRNCCSTRSSSVTAQEETKQKFFLIIVLICFWKGICARLWWQQPIEGGVFELVPPPPPPPHPKGAALSPRLALALHAAVITALMNETNAVRNINLFVFAVETFIWSWRTGSWHRTGFRSQTKTSQPAFKIKAHKWKSLCSTLIITEDG